MTDVRRADPAARRLAVLVLLVATLVGAALIVAFERYRVPLREWVLSEPEEQAQRTA
jgi:ABC-type spermidine/putrescine transport system permease subunit II